MLRDPEVAYRRRWLTLTVLCVSLLVIVLDNTILNVAIPTLARPKNVGGIAASASQLQWIVDSYTVVFAGLLLTAGSLGDRFGRYRALVIGLSIFGFGSLLSALSNSPTSLIVTRSLMGIGGAFIMPSTLSILTNVFHDPHERRKAIGIWAGVAGLGALGPITGGFLLSHFWWGSVFLVNVPIVIAGLVAGYFLIPDSRDPSTPKLDPVGALLSIAGLSVVLWGVIEAPSAGWTAPQTLLAFGVGAAVLALFIRWELTYASPMLNMRFFQNPRFSAASGAITLTFFTLFGTLFIMTQYLQVVRGFSALKAGLVLGPQALMMLTFAPTSSIWVGKFGNKRVVATGLGIVAISLLLVSRLTPDTPTILIIGTTMMMGVGMANIMAPATDSIMGSLPRAKAGVGSAVNDTTRQTGGAFGVAVLGSLLASRYSSEVTHILGTHIAGEVKDNVGAAHAYALTALRDQPELQRRIVDAANTAFVSGFHLAAIVGACVIALTAIAVLKFLPARGDEMGSGTPDDAHVAADVGG
ncbi:MAG: MFS transporter [Actinobacteria bacterium]|nr:MFS transporter [Actinomycetota bacterium]